MSQANWDLPSTETTLLKMFFCRFQKDGVDIKPLTRQLSTLYGAALEGRGYLAILSGSLSKRQTRSIKWAAGHQLKLAQECIQEMESILTALLECSEKSTEPL